MQTRLNDLPTVSIVLCQALNNQEAVFIDQSNGVLGSDQYRFATKQAIHKNMVQWSRNTALIMFSYFLTFKDYLFGNRVGIVDENGDVDVTGLKDGVRLFYSDELGLIIEQSA
ncbi:MAG: hypothetical protein R3B95_02840 [Nitrospirales bacterium]|nr:hypothetical protein [Nitrospirales bacterium]